MDALTVITLLVAALLVLGFIFWLAMGLAIFLGAATMEDRHDDFPLDKDFENRRTK
jgi:hypothetical protein